MHVTNNNNYFESHKGQKIEPCFREMPFSKIKSSVQDLWMRCLHLYILICSSLLEIISMHFMHTSLKSLLLFVTPILILFIWAIAPDPKFWQFEQRGFIISF